MGAATIILLYMLLNESDDSGSEDGVFGEYSLDDVVGWHKKDGLSVDGLECYMPVTRDMQAIQAAKQHISGYAPKFAEYINDKFDGFESIAKKDDNGLLFRYGSLVTKVMGGLSRGYLGVFGKLGSIGEQYADMISTDAFLDGYVSGKHVSTQRVIKHDVSMLCDYR